MVSREIIEQVLEKSLQAKCHEYPKSIALKYYNEHKENFVTETYGYGVDSRTIPSPVGRLQQIQADLQEEIYYESLERGVLRDYSTNSFIPLSLMLNGVPDWEDICRFIGYDFGNGFVMPVLDFDKDNDPNYEGSPWVDMSMPQESKMLSQAIDKSPRVQSDCIVFRYGELPLDIPVGGHGTFKNFLSTSYNPYVAFEDIPNGGTWVQGSHAKQTRYKLTINVMKGTKGIVLNRHTGCPDWQSELLLDKNQRYIVLSRDDTNMTAEILLY